LGGRKSKHSQHLPLEVMGWSTADGGIVHQWEYVNAASQQWKIESVGDEYYRIVARHSGKCVDVEGANVHQWSCHGGDNQTWN
jgi:hypothetical protein